MSLYNFPKAFKCQVVKLGSEEQTRYMYKLISFFNRLNLTNIESMCAGERELLIMEPAPDPQDDIVVLR